VKTHAPSGLSSRFFSGRSMAMFMTTPNYKQDTVLIYSSWSE
jgi:hypothetical protein